MNAKSLRLASIVLLTAFVSSAQPSSYTLKLMPGYNPISNPLDVGNNSVAGLYPFLPDQSVLYKLDAATGGYRINTYDASTGWEFTSGPYGTMQPGEGAWLFIPSGAASGLDFVIHGQPHAQAPRLDWVMPGYNLVGSQHLHPTNFVGVFGFPPRIGDVVYRYDPPQPTIPNETNASSVHTFGPLGWDVAPLFAPARASFVRLTNGPRVAIAPARQLVAPGGTARFTAVTFGGTPSSFRWKFEQVPLAGQFGPQLVISNAQQIHEGLYTVDVTFGGETVTSLPARLGIARAPVIAKHPVDVTVLRGQPAQFEIGPGGSPPFAIAWFRNGLRIVPFEEGTTNLFFPAAQINQQGVHFAVVTNVAGAVTSNPAMLRVLEPPIIVNQPPSINPQPGQPVTLGVVAQGSPTLRYQWLLNGNAIPGATNQTFLVSSNAQPSDSGAYQVLVSNPAGSVLSQTALVQVNATDLSFIVNDQFGVAPIVTAPMGTGRGTNTGATLQPDEPRIFGKRGGHSLWMRYMASTPGILRFRTRGSSFDTLLAAYTENRAVVGGGAIPLLRELAADDDTAGFLSSQIEFNVRPNELYHISIDGLGGASGHFILDWDLEPTADLLPVIIEQPRDATVAPGSNALFTVFTETPPTAVQWFFNGQPLPNATQPGLLLGNVGLNNLGEYFARVRMGTRTRDTRAATLELGLLDQPGSTQSARSYDKYADAVTAALQPGGAPFAPAALVLGYTGTQVFNTAGAGGEIGEPVHCGVPGGGSRWYAYIPPANGRLFLNTDGSSFDTILAVYTGCCDFETLDQVECDNDSGLDGRDSSLSFPATNNVIYYIAVDGVDGARGNVRLNYRLLVPMVLTNAAKAPGNFSFRFTATPSYPFTVQRSTNCQAWMPILTNTTPSGIFNFSDPGASPGRFYYRTQQTP